MVRLEPPVFVTVSDIDSLLPTVTLPKPRLDGLSPKAPGETPVPVNGKVSVAFDAFELIVTFPLTLPAAWGANVTVKVVLCEAFNVSGVVIPLIWNPDPDTAA